MAHTLKETIDLAVKTAILRAHPIGSYYLTEGDEDPADFIGGWNRLKSLVIQASDDKHAAGTEIEAGLPDIQGECVLHGSEQASIKTRYNSYRTPAQLTENPNATSGGAFTFRASSYNSIYGNSDTVQPPARFCNVWKRVS